MILKSFETLYFRRIFFFFFNQSEACVTINCIRALLLFVNFIRKLCFYFKCKATKT